MDELVHYSGKLYGESWQSEPGAYPILSISAWLCPRASPNWCIFPFSEHLAAVARHMCKQKALASKGKKNTFISTY